jgi:hypothetical protein
MTNNKLSFQIDTLKSYLIEATESIFDMTFKRHLDLTDHAVRNALIELGWSPPSTITTTVIAREALEKIAGETYCDGSGCIYCKGEAEHPKTWAAKEAQKALERMEGRQ